LLEHGDDLAGLVVALVEHLLVRHQLNGIERPADQLDQAVENSGGAHASVGQLRRRGQLEQRAVVKREAEVAVSDCARLVEKSAEEFGCDQG